MCTLLVTMTTHTSCINVAVWRPSSCSVHLVAASQAKSLKNKASSDLSPLCPSVLLCTWGHLATRESEAVGPLIDSVNDHMEKGK